MNYKLLNFAIPSYQELNKMEKNERLNYYRRLFALSRYNRLIIQFFMIKNAVNDESNSIIADLQDQNLLDFTKTIQYLKESRYWLEFLAAITEEEEALKKIIDVYTNRLNQNFETKEF
ncbi:MAG TPA: hypothetical protein VFK40_08835 [Nitrososphaeraceae archaeon]|nr:hypothetical protein [Nitrososphaeraceae archaeon]